MRNTRLLLFGLIFLLCAVFLLAASAGDVVAHKMLGLVIGASTNATVSLSPLSGTYGIGQPITVKLLIVSHKELNIASIVLSYPAEILEVEKISREKSIFDLWFDTPLGIEEEGKITIVGGISSGFSGSGELLSIVFRPRAAGTAPLVFEDGFITCT